MSQVTELRQIWITPLWHEDEALADRLWRAVVSALGPACDELWLRFGNLEELQGFLPAAQYQRLEERVGPFWGRPDPMRTAPPTGEVQSILSDVLDGLVGDFTKAGFAPAGAPARAPKYAPYGCAVVPMTPDLLDLIVNLTTTSDRSTAQMLSTLADHWHFRCAGRDVIGTGDGMSGMGLHLTASEEAALRRRLAAEGLDAVKVLGAETP